MEGGPYPSLRMLYRVCISCSSSWFISNKRSGVTFRQRPQCVMILGSRCIGMRVIFIEQ